MKLFIPGPVSIPSAITTAMQKDMIGHRGKEFSSLFQSCAKGLQEVFQTKNRVLISTSSGSGLMEATIRNCVSDSVLMVECGAFGKKWAEIAKSCGKNVDVVSVPSGKGVRKETIEAALSQKKYDAVCVTHNETSTGVMNHLEELSPIIKENGALFCVDTVSSMGGASIPVDTLGIDVCVTSSQKAFSLPPGLSFASVSESALEKAKFVKGRGYYFDFLELAKEYDTFQTPYTPAVGLIFGLGEQLRLMREEGLQNVWARHEKLAQITQLWAKEKGMNLFAEEGYRSTTITCIENSHKVNLEEVKKKVKAKGFVMDAGYRKVNDDLLKAGKPDTFRIPHLGNLPEDELKKYLAVLSEEMGLTK